MSTRTVTNQTELDAAIADGAALIEIGSPRGVWLTVRATDSSTVRAYGSSTVTAYDSSTVTAYGSSTVTATDSSTVTANGSSTVTANGSSTVTAYDSSTVRAYDSSTVTAYGSSTVTAYDSSTVTANGSSTVRASKYVAVHLFSPLATISGDGHIIDVTGLTTDTPEGWLDYYGPDRTKARITVYKAVDADLQAGHGYLVTTYEIGKTIKCPDWIANASCGNGLHFGPTPAHAVKYYNGSTPPRFLECTVPARDFVALGDKIKAPSCKVIREVDEAMRPVKEARHGN